ncbi:MAG: signal peptidase I [bacterium]|nr:signal peptidase I [bacterium]
MEPMEIENKEMTQNGNPEAKEPEKKEESTSFLRELISWVEVIVAAVLISLFLTEVVLVNAMVPTASMENLIDVGDRLFGNRLAYKFHEPERFDVVIFKNPQDESENYIKRLIGLPGEHVEIRDAKIYINGSDQPLVERYLPEEWEIENDGYVFDVPKDSYLMLGDNRNVSLDARYWAEEAYENGLADSMEAAQKYTYVNKKQLLGKAMFTYYPHFSLLSDYEE